MVGFYILSIAFAGILLYIPYAEWTYAGCLYVKLAFILYKKGWNVNAAPGEPVVLQKDDMFIESFTILNDFSSGKLREEEWIELCRNAGIDAVNIGRVAVGGFQREEQLA